MSRPRSATGRGASPAGGGRGAGAGRAPGGRPGVYVQTPKADVYVTMLGIALAAMIIGTVLLGMILKRYDFKVKAASFTPAQSALLAADLEKPAIRVTVHL